MIETSDKGRRELAAMVSIAVLPFVIAALLFLFSLMRKFLLRKRGKVLKLNKYCKLMLLLLVESGEYYILWKTLAIRSAKRLYF